MSEAKHTLDANLQAELERHRAAELHSESELEAQLDAYVDHLHAAFEGAAIFNLDLAIAIADGCRKLLEGFDARPEDERRDVQAACTYLIEEEDDAGDLESVIGFDDDAEVFNHVAEKLGLSDLIVEF